MKKLIAVSLTLPLFLTLARAGERHKERLNRHHER